MKKTNTIFPFPKGTNFFLQRGNCVAFMRKLPSKCFNTVMTDIPYGEINGKVKGNKRLDVGVADEVHFNLRKVIEQFIRLSRENIVVFCGIKQISTITSVMEEHGLKTRLVTWYKPNGRPHNAQYNLCSSAEYCVVGRFPKATFNGYYIKNVITYSVCRNKKGEKRVHATQKPLVLMRDLVQIFTNEGDTIFDPFMGSGTTGEAAIGLGRKFVGCELCDKYFDFAQDRIEHTVLNMPAVFCDGRYQYKKPQREGGKRKRVHDQKPNYPFEWHHDNRFLILYNQSINKETTTTHGTQARRVACIPEVRTLSPLCICTVSYQIVDLPHVGNWDFTWEGLIATIQYLARRAKCYYANGPPSLLVNYIIFYPRKTYNNQYKL